MFDVAEGVRVHEAGGAGHAVAVRRPKVHRTGIHDPDADRAGARKGLEVRVGRLDAGSEVGGRVEEGVGLLGEHRLIRLEIPRRGGVAVDAHDVAVAVGDRRARGQATESVVGHLVGRDRDELVLAFRGHAVQGNLDDHRR